jgi:Tfp pilus assembly protein PilF
MGKVLRMLHRQVTTIIATIIFVVVFAGQALAQGGNSIRGKVRDANGNNVPRVTVDLHTGTGGQVDQTTTNNEGDFFFGGLTDISYVVDVRAADYAPVSEPVEFTIRAGRDVPGEMRTIELTLIAKERLRPPRAGVTFVQNVPPTALDALEHARKSLAAGRSKEAQSFLATAITIFPDYFDAHFLLANELIKNSQLDDAIKELNEAQRINAKDDRVWYLFGTVLMQQGKYAVAARVFAEAARLSPLDADYPFMQGVSLLNQAVITQPNSKQATDVRTYFFDEAEKTLRHAYDVSGQKLHVVYLQLARLYEKRGDRARAADELEEFLKKSPDAKNAQAIRDAIKKLKAAP